MAQVVLLSGSIMKKSSDQKKLRLRKEMIRRLDRSLSDEQLREAAGGRGTSDSDSEPQSSATTKGP